MYGYSKCLFDRYVRRVLPERTAQIAGFRYFNVYGPREAHKGRMASVAYHFVNQYRAEGRVRLFEGSGGYPAGEQRRDFIHVDDVVAANLDFLGIRNVRASSISAPERRATFNAVAVATINACGTRAAIRRARLPSWSREARSPTCRFPPRSRANTRASRKRTSAALRACRLRRPMLAVEEGVQRYVESLISAERFRLVSLGLDRMRRASARRRAWRRVHSTLEGDTPCFVA